MSRPLEGLVAVSVSLAWLILGISRRGLDRRELATWLLGIGIPVVLMLTWQGYYNLRVTGDVMQMPYAVYEGQYALAPNLLSAQRNHITRTYRHDVIRQYHQEFGQARWQALREPSKFVRSRLIMLGWSGLLFTGPFLLLIGEVRRPEVRSRMRGVGPPLLAVTALVGLSMGAYPHYLAPVTGLCVLTAMVCLRSALGDWRRSALHALAVVSIALFCFQVSFGAIHRPQMGTPSWLRAKQAIASRLERTAGLDLVLIRYGPEHNVDREWVYNGAEFDQETILWARSMGSEADERLARAYGTRAVWLLDLPADDDPRIQPFLNTNQAGVAGEVSTLTRASTMVQGSGDSTQTGSK
ncbi:MAG: hypothetical protein R6X22_10110 [Gemmatimonadota bacterium]